MTRKKLVGITVAAVTAAAVVCTAGVTLAIGTADRRSSGSLTAKDLKLTAVAKNVSVYSAVEASADDYAFTDENGMYYNYVQSVVQGDGAGVIGFANHTGEVKFDEKSVAINNILPGDKVEFDIEVTSTSTVSFNYRAELYVESSQGKSLLNQLDFSAGELGLLRKDVTQTPSVGGGELSAAVFTDYTEWTTQGAYKDNVETVHVTVSLPITATEGQGESVKFYYVASGLQNTVSQEDVVRFKTPLGEIGFKTVAEAVEYAKENDIEEIPVVGNTVLEEGEIKIDNVLHFNGVADEDGNYPVLKGARFIIENSAAAAFNNVNFSGGSYIDVSRATVLTLTGCKVNVTPIKYFDGETREFLPDEAFIVSGSTLTPVRLTVKNCSFVSGSGAAICLRSPLYTGKGTEISGNTFGAESRPYTGTAALVFGGASGSGIISVNNNRIYANRAVSLGGKAGGVPYLVVSRSNTAYGIKDGIFADGTPSAAFVDDGSQIGENALICANLSGGLAFGGVDVKINSIDRITAGNITVSDGLSMAEFYTRFVVGNMLGENAIVIYRDGVPYAYLNSADSESGYVLDLIG